MQITECLKKSVRSSLRRAFVLILMVFSLFLIMPRNAFCVDSTAIAVSSYNVNNTYVIDAEPPYPVGFFLYKDSTTTPLNSSRSPGSASCPSGTISSTPLVYARQVFETLSACLRIFLQTGAQWGGYYYMSNYDSPVSPLDADIMIDTTNLYTSATSTSSMTGNPTCAFSNYIRANWFQYTGYALNPTDCTSSVSITCRDTSHKLYLFYPVEYSNTPFSSSSNAITYTARIACTVPSS